MTNKITLSRELAELCYRALNGGDNQLTGMEHGRAFRELRAALTSQHVVCSAGILCQNRECEECGGNGSYIPPLADPVPPAGVEPEVLPLIHINPAVLGMLRGDTKRTAGGLTYSMSSPVGGWTVPLYEQRVITRLQAEAERLKQAGEVMSGAVTALDKRNAEVDALQSELTKARELLADVAKTPWMYDVLGSVREYLDSQEGKS